MVTVNAMGDKCPVPVIKTKKALDALTAPETIEVLVDNETAVANVTKMAQSTGAAVTQEKLGENEYKSDNPGTCRRRNSDSTGGCGLRLCSDRGCGSCDFF